MSSRAVSPANNQFLTPHPLDIDGMKPTTVQFNINGLTDVVSSTNFIVPSRGILQNKTANYLDSNLTSYQDREMESYEIRTDLKHKTMIQIPSRNESISSIRSSELSTKTGPSPAPRRKFYNSTGNLHTKSSEPNASTNPRSTQKGLLRVVNSAHSSPSRIPRRKSLTGSMENVYGRRGSIPADRRKKSNESDSTTDNVGQSIIDLGFVAAGGNSNHPTSRSLSRISKPTTLSPIIGTPNKDSEQSAQEDEQYDRSEMNSTNSTMMVMMSPTKIPMRDGSANHLLVRANSNIQPRSKLGVSSKNNSRVNSRSNSRASSREPSPGSSLTKATSSQNLTRTGSKQFVRNVTNRASDSKLVTKKLTTAATKQSNISTTKKTSQPADKLRSSVKKTSSLRKDANNSSIKKPPATTKKESSIVKNDNIKKPPSNLKRESSNLKKESLLKREPSNLSRTSTLKRQSSKLIIASSVLSKNNSDSSLAKRLEKKNSFKNEKRRTISESNDETGVVGSKENNQKLVPMTKTNVVSMTTAAITAQPVSITTAVTNHNPVAKTNSSNRLTGDNENNNSNESKDSENATMSTTTTPATILEKSQKTLENIQKTVTNATDEIHRTIDENLTDLKSLEQDMKNEEATKNNVPTGGAKLEKKPSTRTLGENKNDEKLMTNDGGSSQQQQPQVITTNASPIDANVSIIENTANGSKLSPQNSDERVSERSISVLPDVELESGNVKASGESDKVKNQQPTANTDEAQLNKDKM